MGARRHYISKVVADTGCTSISIGEALLYALASDPLLRLILFNSVLLTSTVTAHNKLPMHEVNSHFNKVCIASWFGLSYRYG